MDKLTRRQTVSLLRAIRLADDPGDVLWGLVRPSLSDEDGAVLDAAYRPSDFRPRAQARADWTQALADLQAKLLLGGE